MTKQENKPVEVKEVDKVFVIIAKIGIVLGALLIVSLIYIIPGIIIIAISIFTVYKPLQCPSCKKRLKVMQGKKIQKCKKCKKDIKIKWI